MCVYFLCSFFVNVSHSKKKLARGCRNYIYIYIYMRVCVCARAHACACIRMDLQEVGCGYMDWIGLAQDRDRWRKLVSAVMSLRVP